MRKSGLGWNKGWIQVKIVHDFIGSTAFSHTDDETHGIIKREFAKMLARKITSRIFGKQPVEVRHVFDEII